MYVWRERQPGLLRYLLTILPADTANSLVAISDPNAPVLKHYHSTHRLLSAFRKGVSL